MKWVDKLERKYGRHAIHGLMKYIVGANLAVYLLALIMPGILGKLALVPHLVMQGQIWRVFTFILIPPDLHPIWIFFTLYLYYMIGTGLEQAWGSFKFNMYYLTGILLTVIVTLASRSFFGTAGYLNLSLFLAFATIYPDHELLLFFILPVKMKYLAILDVLLLVEGMITGGLPAVLMVSASLANYLLFFWNDFLAMIKLKKTVKKSKKKFKVIEMKDYVRHRCTVCGITERDDPNMEFRYCSKCSGHKEYCMNHLKNHEHTTE